MNFKTSTTIAIKFTAYVITLFIIVGVMINIGFLVQRHQWENWKLDNWWPVFKPGKLFKEPINKVITLAPTQEIIEEIKENTIIANISKIDETYIIYRIQPQKIKIIEVNRLVEMQSNLLRITIIIIALWAMTTFLFARIFVASSLSKIQELVQYVKDLDIHKLTMPVPLSGPEDDEIRIIAQTLQSSLDTIKIQTDSLKDFVSYASHELKTPLATIRWLVDLWTKTKNIEVTWTKIKKTLTEMNNLLDSLVSITKWEFSSINKEETDIIPLIRNTVEHISKQFEYKNIILLQDIPQKYIVSGKSEIISIIISNIVQNAYKFTPENGNITILIEDKKIIVEDTWPGIALEDQNRIWTRFWKKNTTTNEWYGLGLYMVKLLIEKLWRSITVKSIPNTWTSFIIYLE